MWTIFLNLMTHSKSCDVQPFEQINLHTYKFGLTALSDKLSFGQTALNPFCTFGNFEPLVKCFRQNGKTPSFSIFSLHDMRSFLMFSPTQKGLNKKFDK